MAAKLVADVELVSISKMVEAFEALAPDQRRRVLDFLNARYGGRPAAAERPCNALPMGEVPARE